MTNIMTLRPVASPDTMRPNTLRIMALTAAIAVALGCIASPSSAADKRDENRGGQQYNNRNDNRGGGRGYGGGYYRAPPVVYGSPCGWGGCAPPVVYAPALVLPGIVLRLH